MHLGNTNFGTATGVLQTGHRRGTGATSVAGDVDDISACFRHANGDGPDAFR